jgi:hypothetical protein
MGRFLRVRYPTVVIGTIPRHNASTPVRMFAFGAFCATPSTNIDPNSKVTMAKKTASSRPPYSGP